MIQILKTTHTIKCDEDELKLIAQAIEEKTTNNQLIYIGDGF